MGRGEGGRLTGLLEHLAMPVPANLGFLSVEAVEKWGARYPKSLSMS